MLRNKYRMPAHRRLFAVVGRLSGREPLCDEVGSVFQHHRHATLVEISPLFWTQTKPRAESQSGEPWKHIVKRAHHLSAAGHVIFQQGFDHQTHP
jgi:hypothetical protein